MLHRLAIRDFVIVDALEIELGAGLHRAERRNRRRQVDPGRRPAARARRPRRRRRGARRRGARRDHAPSSTRRPSLAAWLADAGFDADADDAGRLLLRRTIDAPGQEPRLDQRQRRRPSRSCAKAGEALVDIHGQHAWQSLDPRALGARHPRRLRAGRRRGRWPPPGPPGATPATRSPPRSEKQGELERERERLAWQLGEIDKLAPGRRRMAGARRRAQAPGQRPVAARRRQRRAGRDLRQRRRTRRRRQSLVAGAIDALDGRRRVRRAARRPDRGAARRRRRSCATPRTRSSGYLDRTELDPSGCAPSTSGCRPGSAWRAAIAGRRPSWPRCERNGRTSCARSTPPPTSTACARASDAARAAYDARRQAHLDARAAPPRPSSPPR